MHSVWNMQEQWELIDKEIAESPMPPEYQGATVRVGVTSLSLTHTGRCDSSSRLQILCNDCQNHCTAPFHVLGMKCSCCGSYNTAQNGGVMQEEQQEAQGQVPHQGPEEEEHIDEEEAAS